MKAREKKGGWNFEEREITGNDDPPAVHTGYALLLALLYNGNVKFLEELIRDNKFLLAKLGITGEQAMEAIPKIIADMAHLAGEEIHDPEESFND